MGLNVKLVVVGGDIKTTEIDLKLPAIIGRGRGAAILLPHPLVSRQHCELFENDGCLMVRDMGSLNGTYIGQDKVTEAALPPGGLLTVGAVTFRAVYDGEDIAAENNDGRAGDTAVGLSSAPFGEETVPTDDVIVVDSGPVKPAPASIIPTLTAPRPVTPAAAPVAKPVAPAAVKPVAPAAKPVGPAVGPPAAAPSVGPPAAADGDDEKADAEEAEDDFQSFLKGLDGK